MNTGFLFQRRTRQVTTIALLALAAGTMVAARQRVLFWWAAQAEWVALGYVVLAMALLIFNRTRLMFVCLGCSAAICLFFNEIRPAASALPASGKSVPGIKKTDPTAHDYPTPTQ